MGFKGKFLGVRVAIHERGALPSMHSQSLAAGVGDVTFFNVQAQRVEHLGRMYGDCMHTWPEELKLKSPYDEAYRYTIEACLEICLAKNVAITCKCKDSFHVRLLHDSSLWSLRYCLRTNDSDNSCRDGVHKRYEEKSLLCPCKIPCNMTEYSILTSRSSWPAEHNSYFAATKISNLQKPIEVREFMTKTENYSAPTLLKTLQDNFAQVEVSFRPSPFKKISEKPAYTASDLVSDFGGNISLWLGWSIFALFEVLIFLLRCFKITYACLRND